MRQSKKNLKQGRNPANTSHSRSLARLTAEPNQKGTAPGGFDSLCCIKNKQLPLSNNEPNAYLWRY
jgi:hypothetical protein